MIPCEGVNEYYNDKVEVPKSKLPYLHFLVSTWCFCGNGEGKKRVHLRNT